MKKISIAVDGGSGTWKGTTAKGVATALGYAYVDTGAMYRAVTRWLLDAWLLYAPEEVIATRLSEIQIVFWHWADEGTIWVCGNNVTDAIRRPEINDHVARIAAFPAVRAYLRLQQHVLAAAWGVVMDGRDMWSVVIPHAELKVFLTCELDERAQRRWTEMREKGVDISLEIVKKNIQERDLLDYTWKTPTSEKAPDARELDTTNLTIEQQIALVTARAREIIGQ